MESNQLFSIRKAVADDVPLILQFILDLAEYEQLRHEVVTDEDTLRTWIFERHGAEVLIAQEGDEPVGFALHLHRPGPLRHRPGGSVRPPGAPGEGLRPGPAQAAGRHRRGGGLRTAGVVVPGLAQALHRLLSLPPRPAHGRVDGLPRGGGGPHQSGQGRLNRGI